ncbi:MAG: 4Fe-4S dicluster domain-containing protein [Anaerolineae bacterium]|nr:4Fe-4S dicluster domain-containing protein [Anaerolineae bacterium]
MKSKILQRDKLTQFVDALINTYEVIAPKDELAYGKIESGNEIRLDPDKPTESLKASFFPSRETLFEYTSTKEGVELSPPPSLDTRRVIFSRPCDAASLPILDKLFAWDYLDNFYLERRENTVVISLACDQPPKECFCPSLGGSPAGTDGADLLLSPLDEDVYHVQVVSERGSALVEEYGGFFTESSTSQDQKQAQLEAEWCAQISKHVDADEAREALDFDSPVWQTLTQQCVDCGICTYVCPTCHCFDIQDEGGPQKGIRVRLWDSCAFQNYTKTHAAQPRPTHYRRYRQRILHKFKYYPENFGRFLCVGCGRCILHCPASIDLTQVLEAAKECT